MQELEYQAEVAEWIGADVINIHGGGAYGDKRKALDDFARGLDRLSARVRSRLTVEIDDKIFTPSDLLPICKATAVPLVYDVHHHRCHPDQLSIEQATEMATATWNRETSGQPYWQHPLRLRVANGSQPQPFGQGATREPGVHVVTPMMRLQDSKQTKMVIVTLPETTPVLEVESLQADLRRAGIEPWAWVINSSLSAASPTDPLLIARAAEERQHIERVQRSVARVAIIPWLTKEPTGSERLLELSPPTGFWCLEVLRRREIREEGCFRSRGRLQSQPDGGSIRPYSGRGDSESLQCRISTIRPSESQGHRSDEGDWRRPHDAHFKRVGELQR